MTRVARPKDAVRLHPTSRPNDSATRVRLIATAERLVADNGPGDVSARQICAAAGQTNNFAVQYHFGSKEGLLEAVFEHRLQRIDAVRYDLLADASAGNVSTPVRDLLDVMMLPLADEVLDPDSKYVSFVSRVYLYQFSEVPLWFDGERLPVSRIGVRVNELIKDQLSHLPEAVRNSRVRIVLSNCLLALANYEQRLDSGRSDDNSDDRHLPFSAFVIDLLDTAAHALVAPLSDAAVKALGSQARPG